MSATLTQGFQHDLISISGEKIIHPRTACALSQSRTLWDMHIKPYINLAQSEPESATLGLEVGHKMITSKNPLLRSHLPFFLEEACKTENMLYADRLEARSRGAAAAPHTSQSKHGEECELF